MSQEKRSLLMSKIRGKDTLPERLVFEALAQEGLSWSSHVRELPGCPDIVFDDAKLAIFIDGDFWHGWRFQAWRNKLTEEWEKKISDTRIRDTNNRQKLKQMGWTVIRFWEHQVYANTENVKKTIMSKISKGKQRLEEPRLKINVLDLFCGAGGSAWGAFKAGSNIVLGVDGWERAVLSYSLNFNGNGFKYIMDDNTCPQNLGLSIGDINLLLASPECTNHTCAKGSGFRDEDSKKTANYVINFAVGLKPKWIILENVVHMKQWAGFLPLISNLESLGYGCTVQTIDASDFGVPQSRRRMFILCHLGKAPTPVSIPDIPIPAAYEILDYNLDSGIDIYPSSKLINPRRAKPTLERFKRGVEVLGKGNPFLIVYYGSDAAGGWQSLDRPLRTITTLDRFGLVTWKGKTPYLRMLQVSELRRAMGFLDTDAFTLTGTRREQIKQLGNGVCPPVMEAIVRHLCYQRT